MPAQTPAVSPPKAEPRPQLAPQVLTCAWARKVIKAVKIPQGKTLEGDQDYHSAMREVYEAELVSMSDDPEIMPRFTLRVETEQADLFHAKKEYVLTVKDK